jgi:hypothetical protein
MSFVSEELRHIPVRVEQILKRHPHREVHVLVRIVPVLKVVPDHEQYGQPDGWRRGLRKGNAAEVFSRRLCLLDQAPDVGILILMLDAQVALTSGIVTIMRTLPYSTERHPEQR